MYASEPLRIGVITDLHYLSPKLMEEGSVLDKYVASSARTVQYTPAVLDKVFDYYAGDASNNRKHDVLLITGDLTKDGERQSHIDLANRLKTLREQGMRIYVIPGNHDINMPSSVGYKADSTYRTPNISPSDFTEIYKDCGYSSAIKRDTASLSYLSELCPAQDSSPATWLLAIDAARYNEYKTTSISGGRIPAATERWITDILDEAQQKHITVIGMMHWGLVEHIMHQNDFFPNYLINDNQRLAGLFADKGMKVIFTGHFHTNDISLFTSPSGNQIYDIETGTLSSYPYTYRSILYSPHRMEISTLNVESVPQNKNMMQESKEQLQKLTERLSLAMLHRKGMGEGKVSQLMAKVMADIFIMHAAGDEKMTDQLKTDIEELAHEMDAPMLWDDIQLDYPPADNNLTIRF